MKEGEGGGEEGRRRGSKTRGREADEQGEKVVGVGRSEGGGGKKAGEEKEREKKAGEEEGRRRREEGRGGGAGGEGVGGGGRGGGAAEIHSVTIFAATTRLSCSS